MADRGLSRSPWVSVPRAAFTYMDANNRQADTVDESEFRECNLSLQSSVTVPFAFMLQDSHAERFNVSQAHSRLIDVTEIGRSPSSNNIIGHQDTSMHYLL